MPVLHAEYETAIAETAAEQIELPRFDSGVANPPTAPAEDTDAAAVVNAWALATLAATTAMTRLMQQIKKPAPDNAASPASVGENETSPASSAPPSFPDDRGPLDDSSTKSGAPPSTENERNGAVPAFARNRHFGTRLDTVASQFRDAPDGGGETEELLQRAITLIDKLSLRANARDLSALRQQVDNIEQRLAYGAYPQ